MEPKWTEKIASSTICNYFYVFFVIFAVWAAISVLGGVWVFATTKMGFGMLLAVLFNTLLSFGISATSALFLYLICERALKPSAEAPKQSAQVHDFGMMM
jgi:hypothetical protein